MLDTSTDVESIAPELGRFDRILVAIEDPGGSPPALLHAIDLASVAQGMLICAIVICSEALQGDDARVSKQRVKAMRGKARSNLERITRLAVARGLTVEGIILEGIATDAILEVAIARQVTTIVIGANQRRVLERLLFGGASDDVLRRRHLPITVVPG